VSQNTNPRFRIDDQVFFSIPSMSPRNQQIPEKYTVVSVMPVDQTGVFQYRIRPSGAGPQRVATELELKR
jgi:hypothetical protein